MAQQEMNERESKRETEIAELIRPIKARNQYIRQNTYQDRPVTPEMVISDPE
jgi:hypothetical protein